MITVLCVSGDEARLVQAREALERDGDLRAGLAVSGKDALSFLAMSPCDAVVADISLRDMDGIALLAAVRRTSRIPFILITDTGAGGREDEAIAAGADFCFTTIPDTPRQYARVARWIRLAVDRSRKDAELAGNESRYHELIENANLLILKLDKDSRITFVNEYALRFFGIAREDVLEKPLAETPFCQTGPDPKDGAGPCLPDPGLDRYAFRETEHVKKNGERVWISWRNKTLAAKDGSMDSVISFGTDMTERRKAEDALYHANRKLNLLNSITRHDILNQLTILGGYVEMSRDHRNARELLLFIDQEKKAIKSIRNMITFTRDYQNIGQYRPQWQYLKNIVSLIANTVDFRHVALHNELGRLEIYADPLFEKVVYTLLENAIRHGGRLTFVRLTYRAAGQDCILVCEDNGIGVPDEDKEKIFQREFGKHTGYGLFLAREILGITGFSIRETGRHGEGARFEILVPRGSFRDRTA